MKWLWVSIRVLNGQLLYNAGALLYFTSVDSRMQEKKVCYASFQLLMPIIAKNKVNCKKRESKGKTENNWLHKEKANTKH